MSSVCMVCGLTEVMTKWRVYHDRGWICAAHLNFGLSDADYRCMRLEARLLGDPNYTNPDHNIGMRLVFRYLENLNKKQKG